MTATPPVREDGRCAGCGGSREKTRTHKGDNATGSRVEASFWRAAVERDPFCSRECCERFHGLLVDEVRACDQCGKNYAPTVGENGSRQSLQRFCSRLCSTRYRQRATYTDKDKCVGCGVAYAERTIGCKHCWDRLRRRERRLNDPGYAARQNEQLAARRARRRAEKQSAPAASGHGIEPKANGSSARGPLQTTTTREAA